MATLMERIRNVGAKAVKFSDRGRPIASPDATSFFVSSRTYPKRSSQNFRDINDAIAERSRAEATEKSGKLIEDFRTNAPEQALASDSWINLTTSFENFMRLEVKKEKGIFSENSADRYGRTLKRFGLFLASKKISLLNDITPALTEAYKEARIDEGAPKGYMMDAAVLHRVFNYGIKEGLLARNPIRYESRSINEDVTPYLPEEIERMKTVLGEDALAFYLLRWTGMRCGDVADLRWGQVNGRIVRTTQKSRKKKKKTVSLPILPELRAALDTERNQRYGGRNPQDYANEHVLVNAETNQPFTSQVLYEHIVKLGKRAKDENGRIIKAHPHRFRHSFAEYLLLRGVGLEDVAELLGDTLKTVVLHYAKYTKQRQDRVDRILLEEAQAASA